MFDPQHLIEPCGGFIEHFAKHALKLSGGNARLFGDLSHRQGFRNVVFHDSDDIPHSVVKQAGAVGNFLGLLCGAFAQCVQ